MKKSNLKQKKIISIIIIIIAVIIYYYFYIKNNTSEEIENQNLEINNTQESESKEETEQKEEKIIVHVSGAVNNEGIVELEANSRIANAIEKAGGIKENADMTDINLAYPLEDGMKIYIPTKQETATSKQNENAIAKNYVTSSSGGVNTDEKQLISSNNSKTSNANKNIKVNINTASQEELDTLPGIGPSIASKIIDYREQNGKFNSIEEIKEVSRYR